MQLSLPIGDDAAACFSSPTELEPPPARVESPPPGVDSGSWPITFVRRRRARRYILRVDPEGGVRVTIPRGGSAREAHDFVARHRLWIDRQRTAVHPPSISSLERRLLRARAASELPARLLRLAERHGLTVTRVTIRNQRTRWGSCGRNGHITLNWRLVIMPDWVSEYVLVHELMHLRRLDHSPAYWTLVAAAFPRYREARHWLRTNAERLR